MDKKWIILISSVLLFFNEVRAQHTHTELLPLSQEAYAVINDIYKNDDGRKLELVSITDFSKTWALIMNPATLNNLLGKCTMNNKLVDWSDVFTESEWTSLNKSIYKLKPARLQQSKLANGIVLKNNISESHRAYSITRPIIIEDYAVFKMHNTENEYIIFASKQSGKWQPLCRKTIYSTFD